MTESNLTLIGGEKKSANEGGHTVPHSQEAEQAILGALLMNNALYFDVEGILSPDYFYVGVHGKVYEAIARLVGKDMVADPISLTDFFGSADWFKELGGRKFLEELNENATTVVNIRTYADIVYNHYLSREIIDIGTNMVNSVYEESEKTPSDLVMDAESRLFLVGEQGSGQGGYQMLRDPLIEVINRIQEARQSDSHLTGVTSGLIDMDEKLGGFQKSDLIILAARPSMGKTALALNLAYNAARALSQGQKEGCGVGVFSLEMSAEQLAGRLLASSSGVGSDAISRGNIRTDEFHHLVTASDELSNLDIFIDDTPALHIGTLRSRARRMKRQGNIGMVIVDYLQLMRGTARKDGNRVQEISEISQGLKAVARELDVPVIALSQLSRAVESRENKRPQLSDLRESGSIEQDADIVMFLYREAYYKEKELGADPPPDKLAELEEIRNLSELIISKNRKGATGGIRLVFDGPTTTFKNYLSS